MRMDIPAVIAIVNERRKGYDIVTKPYERVTHFAASPDRAADEQVNSTDKVEQGRTYVTIVPGKRDVQIRPSQKPPEERGNIVSNRLTQVFGNTKEAHRVESDLEAGLLDILAANPKVVGVKTQWGPLEYNDGRAREHWADILADFMNGCRILYMVRHSNNLGDLPDVQKRIRNQSLKKYAHKLHLVTELEISKPRVYRAQQMLRAMKGQPTKTGDLLLARLREMGDRAVIFELFEAAEPDLSFAEAWTALWALIARGCVEHCHRDALNTIMTRLSTVKLQGAK